MDRYGAAGAVAGTGAGIWGGGVALAPTIKMEKKGGPMRRLLVRSWMSMWM